MAEKTHFENTPYFQWNCEVDSDYLAPQLVYCESNFTLYRIDEIPKIAATANTYEVLISYVIKQKILVESLFASILGIDKDLKGAFEVRLENDPSTRIISTYLVLKLSQFNDRRFDIENYKRQFVSLVPAEFELTEIHDQGEKDRIMLLGEKKLVEIVKTPKFLNIGKISSFAKIAHEKLQLNDVGKLLLKVPSVQSIEPKLNDLSQFYKALQDCDEQVIVRFSIALCEVYNIEKTIAQYYERLLNTEYETSEISSYIASLAKYKMAEHLCSLKVQVASKNVMRAKSIANIFCGQLSNTSLSSNVIYKSFSVPDEGPIANHDWSYCNHYYFNFWEDRDYPSPGIESFTTRLPYLYNTIECCVPFRIPISLPEGLPGMVTKTIKPFYQPNPQQMDTGRGGFIRLGKIIGSGKKGENQIEYKIPIDDLTKHGLIVGTTGSGKTNTTLNVLLELKRQGIPFLLIEPAKAEYFEKLNPYFNDSKSPLNRYNFTKPLNEDGSLNKSFLRFNPLIPAKGISVMQHISFIKSCFCAAFPIQGIMPLILEDALLEHYRKYYRGKPEAVLFDPSEAPSYRYDNSKTISKKLGNLTVQTLSQSVDDVLNDDSYTEDDKTEFGAYLKRRINFLTRSVLGYAICPEKWIDAHGDRQRIQDNLTKIFSESTIIELDDLADNDEKALIMAFILTYLFEYRKSKGPTHVTIIEEAHRLLGTGSVSSAGSDEGGKYMDDSKSKSVNLFVDMLAEIRAKGEGILIVEQIPSKLVADAIKNTNLKIMHRITSKEDRDYLGAAMNMTEAQRTYVTNLKRGEAIVFEENLDHPIFININRFTD